MNCDIRVFNHVVIMIALFIESMLKLFGSIYPLL